MEVTDDAKRGCAVLALGCFTFTLVKISPLLPSALLPPAAGLQTLLRTWYLTDSTHFPLTVWDSLPLATFPPADTGAKLGRGGNNSAAFHTTGASCPCWLPVPWPVAARPRKVPGKRSLLNVTKARGNCPLPLACGHDTVIIGPLLPSIVSLASYRRMLSHPSEKKGNGKRPSVCLRPLAGT